MLLINQIISIFILFTERTSHILMAISSASFYKQSGFYIVNVWQALVMPALTAAVDQEDKGYSMSLMVLYHLQLFPRLSYTKH